jgi:hypothetical protein
VESRDGLDPAGRSHPQREIFPYAREWDNRSWQTMQRSSPQPQGHSRRQRHPSEEQISKKKAIRIPQPLGEVYAQRLDPESPCQTLDPQAAEAAGQWLATWMSAFWSSPASDLAYLPHAPAPSGEQLRIEDGLIAEITTFGYALFPAFGLPPTL